MTNQRRWVYRIVVFLCLFSIAVSSFYGEKGVLALMLIPMAALTVVATLLLATLFRS